MEMSLRLCLGNCCVSSYIGTSLSAGVGSTPRKKLQLQHRGHEPTTSSTTGALRDQLTAWEYRYSRGLLEELGIGIRHPWKSDTPMHFFLGNLAPLYENWTPHQTVGYLAPAPTNPRIFGIPLPNILGYLYPHVKNCRIFGTPCQKS